METGKISRVVTLQNNSCCCPSVLGKVKVCPGAQEARLVECDCFELLDDSSGMNMEGSWG